MQTEADRSRASSCGGTGSLCSSLGLSEAEIAMGYVIEEKYDNLAEHSLQRATYAHP